MCCSRAWAWTILMGQSSTDAVLFVAAAGREITAKSGTCR
jgi:hypothetical protein